MILILGHEHGLSSIRSTICSENITGQGYLLYGKHAGALTLSELSRSTI